MYAQIWRHTVSFTCLAHGSIMPTLNTIFPKNYPTIKNLRLNMRSLSLFKARENEHRPLEKKRTKKKWWWTDANIIFEKPGLSFFLKTQHDKHKTGDNMKIVASTQTLNTGRCMLVPKIPRKTEPKENWSLKSESIT